jgi:alpha-ketoglutarate-dependent taurine dioxygenase
LYINKLNLPVSENDVIAFKKIFNYYPLLIFRNPSKKLTPTEFINFLTIFDEDYDKEALLNPDKYPNQMLQPFDQFPDCKHVAPRGSFTRDNLFGIKHIDVKPSISFISNYVWHTDLLGHPEKNPGVVTGFHIIKNPSIGGETDFISGETIYENLPAKTLKKIEQSRVIINRHNFAFGNKIMDYSGSYRIKDSDIKFPQHNVELPLVFPPETKYQKHKVLIMPSFIENIVGFNYNQTNNALKFFMEKFVLPHRISIQWKEGDICVFNNRCFIHSSTPAKNYLDLQLTNQTERLLLQTFLPTKNIFRY